MSLSFSWEPQGADGRDGRAWRWHKDITSNREVDIILVLCLSGAREGLRARLLHPLFFKSKSRDLKTLSDNGAIIGRAERSDFPPMKKAQRTQEAKGSRVKHGTGSALGGRGI